MKCTDLEILLCDYVDGTLSSAERATVELHLGQCPACRELVELSTSAVAFMGRAAEPEPPAALVNQILFEARKTQQALPAARRASNWFARFFEPILQPKFAMGMAMTILSFSMLGRFAGIKTGEIKAADLEPARVWATLEDKAWRTWDRAQKYYESLRLVYEVRQALSDWNETEDPAPTVRPAQAGQAASPGQAGSLGQAETQRENPGASGAVPERGGATAPNSEEGKSQNGRANQ
jgi:hypothetical protein